MSLRSVFFAVGVLVAGTVLVLIGGFGAMLLLTGQCGASGYLCQAPTANMRDEKAHAKYAPRERRLGSR